MNTPTENSGNIYRFFKYHKGNPIMKKEKAKQRIDRPVAVFSPLHTWRKTLSIFMLGITATWIVPPNVIAAEIADYQHAKAVEQSKRDQRVYVNKSLPIAAQNEKAIQIIQGTCSRILSNLDAKKSVETEIKDIAQLSEKLGEIRTTTITGLDAQRAKLEQRKASAETLKRCEAAKAKFIEKFDVFYLKVKAVADSGSKPEKLRAAITALNTYLDECRKANSPKQAEEQTPARGAEKKTESVSTLQSVVHNGILLASADDTIGDWLTGLDNLAVSGEPVAADLAATPDIVLDDEIKGLAEQLEKNPVKIYEYIRNNFVYEPYWGAQKGAKRTLAEMAGNDVDLASLMMALLRASGIHCRYVCGTIEMPIADAAKWIGVDDPAQIAKTFIANGIPCETAVSGGQIASIKINHTWVKAYVDYFPYRGAVNEKPNTWVELDGSFKQNTFTMKEDLEKTIGINPETLLTNVKAQSVVKPLYASKVPESFILSEIFSYGEPIRSYLAANSLTSENVFRQRKVNEEKYGLLPVTDQYDVIRGLSFDALPTALRGKVTFTLKNTDGSVAFTHEVPLSSLANSRVTLGYAPATEVDRDNIQDNIAAVDFPVYLVNLVPQFKIGDEVIGSGSAIGMGRPQFLEITFSIPGLEPQRNTTELTAGSFNAFVLDYQTVTGDMLKKQMEKLNALISSSSNRRDAVLGESLHALGLSYFHQMDRFNQVTAGNLGVAITRVPSMIRVSWDLNVAEQLNLPFTASVDRIKLDVIRDFCVPVAIKSDRLAGEKQFAFTSALTGTALEHNVLSQPFASESASAARVIQQANKLDKRVFTITAANVNEILALSDINIPSAAVDDIRNAVNANMEVTAPECPVPLNSHEYYAYVKRDIITNASDFVLSKLAGGETVNASLKASDLLADGSAANYKLVMAPVADWLKVAEDSTTNAGLAYLPAITALNNWYANRAELDPVTTIAAIIAVSGPITRVYNQPAILNVVTGDKLISPNGDGIKDSFTFKADVTKGAAWKWQITNPQGTVILTEENTTPVADLIFDQNVPDGTYSYRMTAVVNGVNADPISGTFRVDNTKPTVAITEPNPSVEITNNGLIKLRGTADDVNFEKVTITAQGVGTEPAKIYESNNITVENILTSVSSANYSNGPLTIVMTATDKAGNTNSVTKTYSVANPVPDNLFPTIQMAVSDNGQPVTNGSTVQAGTGLLNVAITATDTVPTQKPGEETKTVAPDKINLYVDGALIASASSVKELTHDVKAFTLSNGSHTIQSEAIDKAGNKTQSPALSFTLDTMISNFKVTPEIAKNGTANIAVTANVKFPAGANQWQLAFSGVSEIPGTNGTTTLVAHNVNPAPYSDGQYEVTLTIGTESQKLPFEIDLVEMAPIAKIANLTTSDEGEIPIVREGLFNLVGTADDPDASDVVSYRIDVLTKDYEPVSVVTPQPRDNNGFTVGRVNNAALGELDFTMLKNDVYILQLTVKSSGNAQQPTAEAMFALNSELKIGQMSFSQQDLVIPVNGQPISVIRTYNSMNTNYTGDFGPGWTYSLKDMEVEFSENRVNIRDDNGEAFSLRQGGSRDVTVTMPDGKRTTFRYRLQAVGQYFQTYRAYWDAAPGVHATLVPTCSNEVIALPNGMQYWQASGPTTDMDNFDIPGFILTTRDGSMYELVREDLGWHEINDYGGWEAAGNYTQAYGKTSLRQITDPNGNRIEFSNDGIQSYNASGEKTKSIVFDRDAANGNRITAIYAPSSLNEDGSKPENAIPQFKYVYDAAGNLAEVHKLIDRTKPVNEQYAVTKYLYEEPDRPHFVTKIIDPLGNAPMRCEYDNDGRLVATIDANGNRIEMNHDLSGRTETITDRMGNPTVHTYDDRGNVTATVDAQGNTTKYSYDSLGNKLSETNALGYTTSYTYDSSGNQTSVTDPLGNVTRYEYDGKGNQTKIVDAMGNVTTNAYDSAGNLLSTTDALGNTTRNEYDNEGNFIAGYNNSGRKIKTVTYQGTLPQSIVDEQGNITNYSHDANGNLTETSYVWTDGEISKDIRYSSQYNDAGKITSTTQPSGNIIQTEYNILEKKVRSIFSSTRQAEFVYNKTGKLSKRLNSDGSVYYAVYDKQNRCVISQTVEHNNTSAIAERYIYDSIGRIIRTEKFLDTIIHNVDSESIVIDIGTFISSTIRKYDALGNIITVLDESGNSSQYEYDARGYNIATIDALGNRTEFTYDALGRQTSVKDPQGNITSYEYDALGRKTKTIFPDGTFTTIKYNNFGQKLEETDAAGLITKFEYDQAGHLTAVVKPEVNGEVPRWEYTYNQYGQRTAIKDPKGNVTNFAYDYAGRQLSRTLPMGQRETAEYNSLGQLVKQTDFKGQTVEITYDTFGRKIAQKYYTAGSTTSSDEVRFTYDGMGRIQSVVQDGLETAEDGTSQPSLRETSYEYNSRGELTQVFTPEGSVNYEYDAKTGAKTRVYTANSDIRYTYDALNRLKTVAVHMRNGMALATPEVTTYDYTKIGSRASVILPNGVTTNYQYDNLNRLTQLTHEKAGAPIASYTYDLLPNGRRAAVTEVTPQGSSEIRYTYDNLYRLIRETRTGVKPFEASYAYDINSNRIQKVIVGVDENDTINYAYNANDQLTSEVSSANGTTVYTYDANGSLTTKINAGQSINCQYGYDLRNRLVSASITRMEGTAPNQPQKVDIISHYAYNADGIRTRVTQTVGDVTQKRYFLLDDGHTGYSQVFEEISSLGGSVVRSYVIGDDVLSQTVGSVTSHLLYDGHGSTRQLANGNGEITDNYAYDAYGKMLGGDPNVTDKLSATDLLYAGEQFDAGLQMEYLRARYYDANSGRFNRLDPFAGNSDDPQSLHKYAYCHADPINRIDPSGLLSPLKSVLGLVIHLYIQMKYALDHSSYFDIEAFANAADVFLDVYKNIHTLSENSPILSDVTLATDFLKGRPDIANRNTGEVFEIKPNKPNQIASARIQLFKYLVLLYLQDDFLINWHLGTDWNIDSVSLGIPGVSGASSLVASVELYEPGIVAYNVNPDFDINLLSGFASVLEAVGAGMGVYLLFQYMQPAIIKGTATAMVASAKAFDTLRLKMYTSNPLILFCI